MQQSSATKKRFNCPKCKKDNEFPCTGYCTKCYDEWRVEMESYYGPGPWVPLGEGKYIRASAYRNRLREAAFGTRYCRLSN